MVVATRGKKNQVQRRNNIQSRRGKLGGKKTAVRRVNHRHEKKRPAGKSSKKARNLEFDSARMTSVRITNEAQNLLHFCVRDLYKKVFLAAERLRKKKSHASITAADIKNALKKFMPSKADRKAGSSVACKCR